MSNKPRLHTTLHSKLVKHHQPTIAGESIHEERGVSHCKTPLSTLKLPGNGFLPVHSHLYASKAFESLVEKFIECNTFLRTKPKQKQVPVKINFHYLKDTQFLNVKLHFNFEEDDDIEDENAHNYDIPCMIYIGASDEHSNGLPTYRFAPLMSEDGTQCLIKFIEEKIAQKPFYIRVVPKIKKPTYIINSSTEINNDSSPPLSPKSNYSTPNVFVGEGFCVGYVEEKKNSNSEDDSKIQEIKYSADCIKNLHLQLFKFNNLLRMTVTPEIIDGKTPNPFKFVTLFCADDVLQDVANGNIPADGVIDVNFSPMFANKTIDLESLQVALLKANTMLSTMSLHDAMRQELIAHITDLNNQIFSFQALPNTEILTIEFKDRCGGVFQNFPENLLLDLILLHPQSKSIVIQHPSFFCFQGTWRFNSHIQLFELTDIKIPHMETADLVPEKLNNIYRAIEENSKQIWKSKIRAENTASILSESQ